MGQQNWATPQEFFDAVVKRFGSFDIDLAATPDNAKCERFINGNEIDSLAPHVEWINEQHTSCWLNPPFGNISEWIKKAYHESQKQENAIIVVLCRIAPSTKWWMKYVTKASEILLLGGKRIQFIPPGGWEKYLAHRLAIGKKSTKPSNPQECCLVCFSPFVGEFPRVRSNMQTWDWTKK